jgi:hypothetical protein
VHSSYVISSFYKSKSKLYRFVIFLLAETAAVMQFKVIDHSHKRIGLSRFKRTSPGRNAIEENKCLLRAKYQIAKGISNEVNGAREVVVLIVYNIICS